jgi:lipoate-protein ligase A
MAWNLIEREAATAVSNMEFDVELLNTLSPEGSPILHLYDWVKPSATYGFFSRPHELLNMEAVERIGFDLARRPTGGGIVFHTWDLAFSVLIPSGSPLYSQNTLENYELINRVVFDVVQDFIGKNIAMSLTPQDAAMKSTQQAFFCMARPTKYDLVVGNKKVVGAAQRKTKQGFLHQGTIALQAPDLSLLNEMLLPKDVCRAMQRATFPLLGENDSLEEGRKHLKELLKYYFFKIE